METLLAYMEKLWHSGAARPQLKTLMAMAAQGLSALDIYLEEFNHFGKDSKNLLEGTIQKSPAAEDYYEEIQYLTGHPLEQANLFSTISPTQRAITLLLLTPDQRSDWLGNLPPSSLNLIGADMRKNWGKKIDDLEWTELRISVEKLKSTKQIACLPPEKYQLSPERQIILEKIKPLVSILFFEVPVKDIEYPFREVESGGKEDLRRFFPQLRYKTVPDLWKDSFPDHRPAVPWAWSWENMDHYFRLMRYYESFGSIDLSPESKEILDQINKLLEEDKQ